MNDKELIEKYIHKFLVRFVSEELGKDPALLSDLTIDDLVAITESDYDTVNNKWLSSEEYAEYLLEAKKEDNNTLMDRIIIPNPEDETDEDIADKLDVTEMCYDFLHDKLLERELILDMTYSLKYLISTAKNKSPDVYKKALNLFSRIIEENDTEEEVPQEDLSYENTNELHEETIDKEEELDASVYEVIDYIPELMYLKEELNNYSLIDKDYMFYSIVELLETAKEKAPFVFESFKRKFPDTYKVFYPETKGENVMILNKSFMQGFLYSKTSIGLFRLRNMSYDELLEECMQFVGFKYALENQEFLKDPDWTRTVEDEIAKDVFDYTEEETSNDDVLTIIVPKNENILCSAIKNIYEDYMCGLFPKSFDTIASAVERARTQLTEEDKSTSTTLIKDNLESAWSHIFKPAEHSSSDSLWNHAEEDLGCCGCGEDCNCDKEHNEPSNLEIVDDTDVSEESNYDPVFNDTAEQSEYQPNRDNYINVLIHKDSIMSDIIESVYEKHLTGEYQNLSDAQILSFVLDVIQKRSKDRNISESDLDVAKECLHKIKDIYNLDDNTSTINVTNYHSSKDISIFSTKELTDELFTRGGIESYWVSPEATYDIDIKNSSDTIHRNVHFNGFGPLWIIFNYD